MDELIRPNWHIVLVHFPLALLTLGTLIEVFSFLGWRRSSLRTFGRWALMLGAILAVPTTFSGLYAMGDVVPEGLAALEETRPEAAEVLRDHLWMSAVATGGAMFLVVAWVALTDVWRDRLGALFKLALLLVTALVVVGAHHGGDLVYALHIGPHDEGLATFPTSLPAERLDQAAHELLGAAQVHVIVSGLAIGLACVCLGWSIRGVAQPEPGAEYDDSTQRIAAAFSPQAGTMTIGTDESGLLRSMEPVAHRMSTSHTPPVRTGGLWLLVTLLAVASAAAGLWYLAVEGVGSWHYNELRDAIVQGEVNITRRFAHFVTGAVIIGAAFLLALQGFFARRSKWLVLILATPMIVALAAQVWLGVLLVMTGPEGTVTRFSPEAPVGEAPAPVQSADTGDER